MSEEIEFSVFPSGKLCNLSVSIVSGTDVVYIDDDAEVTEYVLYTKKFAVSVIK